MNNKSLHITGVILAVLLLAACNGGTTPPGDGVELEVNETAISEDAVAEPIFLNNCGNPASVKQVSQHSQAIMIGGGANIGASGGVISGSVEGKYSSTKNVSKSLTVEAAPNTNMKFVLLWTEKVSEGTVTAEGQSGQATYRVSVPISVELSSAENLGCTDTPEPSDSTSAGPTEIIDDFGVEMAIVPAGDFTMGSDSDHADEKPAHQVFVDAFYMDKYEVTNALYRVCVDEGACNPPQSVNSDSRPNYFDKSKYDNYPVMNVDWNMAVTYCEWRGGRIPSEAEWEKAARGDLEGKAYPWGDANPVCEFGIKNGAKFDDSAKCADTDTEMVGSYLPNGYGLYDMAGNVWEWVADWYDAYPGGDTSASEYFGRTQRVLRGGSWNFDEDHLRVSYRVSDKPNVTYAFRGFRCAR